jgi:serralysin
MAIIIGTNGDDKYPNGVELRGTNLADEIYGLAGSDSLVGFDGDDILDGGPGADELWGGYGFDLASYNASSAAVQINLFYNYSAVGGDAAGDRLYSIEGLVGSAFGDALYGNDQGNVLRGGGGDDVLVGFGGDDVVHGEGGDDSIGGSAGIDRLDGGEGDDLLDGGEGDDVLDGGAGVDTASFESSYNYAGVNADLASGIAHGAAPVGSDRLSGIENLEGTLYGDRLAGNGGANALDGAQGADVLEGRGGADRFVYGQTYESMPAAPDLILDFSRKQGDRIDLSAVDTNDQVPGDPAFRFIGQDPFTDAGQVRFFKAGGDTVVEVNTDDTTAGAEMQIMIDAALSLRATDFVL